MTPEKIHERLRDLRAAEAMLVGTIRNREAKLASVQARIQLLTEELATHGMVE